MHLPRNSWLLALLTLFAPAEAGVHQPPEPVVFSHWWVSPGEQASIDVLKDQLNRRQIDWRELASPGSGTARYIDVLRQRVAAGAAPTASQMIGYDIQDWARQGALVNLDEIAAEQEWDDIIPFGIQHLSKYQGQWVAAPINAHSTNWLWVNAALLAQFGGDAPDTWVEFIELLDRAKAAGVLPLAIGAEAWEHTLLFESVAVGAGGAEFYRKAFLELDPDALQPRTLQLIFSRMSQLRGYLDPAYLERNWTQSTDLLRRRRALLQVQGSWVGGEFNHEGAVPGTDYHCFRFPDTQGVFLFNSDQYVFFKHGPGSPEQRRAMLDILMDKDFQRDLNRATGAAPARVDIDREAFNSCGQRAIDDMRSANMRRTLMGSIAMGNAHAAEVKSAIYALVTDHLQARISDEEASTRLREVIRTYRATQPLAR